MLQGRTAQAVGGYVLVVLYGGLLVRQEEQLLAEAVWVCVGMGCLQSG